MGQIFQNFLSGAITGGDGTPGPLNVGDNTIEATGLDEIVQIIAGAGNYIDLVLDPLKEHGEPEIVRVTEHDPASALQVWMGSGNRGLEGTTERLHPLGTRWIATITAGIAANLAGTPVQPDRDEWIDRGTDSASPVTLPATTFTDIGSLLDDPFNPDPSWATWNNTVKRYTGLPAGLYRVAAELGYSGAAVGTCLRFSLDLQGTGPQTVPYSSRRPFLGVGYSHDEMHFDTFYLEDNGQIGFNQVYNEAATSVTMSWVELYIERIG